MKRKKQIASNSLRLKEKYMGKELKDRIDIRIDSGIKEGFKNFCTKNELTLSDAVRDALINYQVSKTFVRSLVEDLQETFFYDNFNKFLRTLPRKTRYALEDLIGPEEENLITETSPRLLKAIKVVTPLGKEALKNKLEQGIN